LLVLPFGRISFVVPLETFKQALIRQLNFG